MFEKAPAAEQQSTTPTHELRVAVFDLSQKALASASFTAPALVIDRQPLDARGMPGISTEARAIQVSSRNLLGLPPVDVIGRIFTPEENVAAYAVSARRPIDFRRFTLRRFEIDEVIELAREEVMTEQDTIMDHIDAKLILSSLALEGITRHLSPRHPSTKH